MTSMPVHLFISGAAEPRARFAAWFAPATNPQSVTARTDRYPWPEDVQTQRDAVLAQCARLHLDVAILPASVQMSQFRLLAFDMDSTLITIECIDEIADFAGLKGEVAAITEASMRGEIPDFSASLRRRVALLRGLDADVLARVYDERLRLSPGAESLLAGARAAGLKTLLVSGGFTFFTERLKARLALDFALANTLEVIDGKLSGRIVGEIVDGAAKAAQLSHVAVQLGATERDAIAIGDGANDLPMMTRAGLSVAYRAKPIVARAADCAIGFAGLDVLLDWLGAASR